MLISLTILTTLELVSNTGVSKFSTLVICAKALQNGTLKPNKTKVFKIFIASIFHYLKAFIKSETFPYKTFENDKKFSTFYSVLGSKT